MSKHEKIEAVAPTPTLTMPDLLDVADAVDEISDLLSAVFELAGGFSADGERGLTRVISVAQQKLHEVKDALQVGLSALPLAA
jgi:hypothetical protein